MEIKINVDENMFSEVVESELKALKPEEIKEVVLKCISEYLRSNNYEAIKELMTTESKSSYGYYSNRELSLFAQKAIEECDFSELQDVVDKSISLVKENYKDLLMNCITKSLVEALTNNYAFQDGIKRSIDNYIYTMRSNGAIIN